MNPRTYFALILIARQEGELAKALSVSTARKASAIFAMSFSRHLQPRNKRSSTGCGLTTSDH